MSSEKWLTYKLKDVIDVFIDYRGKTPTKSESGIPLITAKIVKSGRIEEPNEFIPEKDFESWMTRGLPKNGDVVLTTEAPLGEVAQINFNGKVALAQRIITMRGKKGVLDNSFLKYALQTNKMQERLSGRSTGTTVTGIKSSELREVEIELPELITQRRIAAILTALDDKIELNRRMNETLEGIALALWGEWFGKYASGEEELPDGWRWGKLGNILELAYGKALKAEERIKGSYPVVGSNGIIGYHSDYIVKSPGIVIGRKGTIGSVTWLHENFFPIDTTFFVVDKMGANDLFFHYFLLSKQDFKKIGSDSAVPGLNRSEAYNNETVIPQIEVINHFSRITKPIFDEINLIEKQTRTLTALRDLLLPRLMRGEILS
jgi:type I restriction enzyme S subunit